MQDLQKMHKAKINKTGKTAQFVVLEEGYSSKHNCVFAKGVYNSFHADDARPTEAEFYVRTATASFAANNLTEALELWMRYREAARALTVTHVERVG